MSGDSETTQTTTTNNQTDKQESVFKKLLKTYSAQIGKNEPYEGERVAPFSDLQRDVLSGAGNYADLFTTPQQPVGMPLNAETGEATKGLLTGQMGARKLTPQDTEDYFNTSYRDPAMKSLREDVNPAIDEAFAGPGFFGSARSQERVGAAQDTSDWLGTKRGELDWNVLLNNNAIDEAKAGRTLSTLPAAMQYGNQPYQNAMNNLQIATAQVEGLGDLFGFGAAEQTQEQAELSADWAKFIESKQITDPQTLQVLMTLLGMSVNPTTTSTAQTSVDPLGPNQWGGVLAGGAATAVTGGLSGLSLGGGGGSMITAGGTAAGGGNPYFL